MRSVFFFLAIMLATGVAFGQGQNPLDNLASSAGNDAVSLVKLGDLYVEAHRFKEAAKVYKAALKVQPKFGEAQFGLARIEIAKAIAKGKFNKAKGACQKVLRAHKDESVGEICMGTFWLSNDRAATATEQFEKAIAKGDIKRGKLGMANVLFAQINHDAAITAYKAAIGAGAGYRANLGLGQVLEVKGDRTGAMAEFKKAVNAQPASCLAQYHYGRLAAGADAINHLETALTIRPNWTDAQLAIGDAQLLAGNTTIAIETFKAAAKGKTKRGAAFFGLGRSLYKMGKTQEAVTALKKAIGFVPNLTEAYLLIADIQYNSGDNQAAIDALEEARIAAPGNASVYLRSGKIYFRMNRPTSAKTFLEQAVNLKSDMSEAHAILGKISCERHLFDKGKKYYKKALAGDMVGVDRDQLLKENATCKSKH